MEKITLIALIIVIMSLVIYGRIRKKYDALVNFLLRACMGLVAIYLLNMGLSECNLSISVGLNSFSALLIGGLGIPGFFLVYGLSTYFYFR